MLLEACMVFTFGGSVLWSSPPDYSGTRIEFLINNLITQAVFKNEVGSGKIFSENLVAEFTVDFKKSLVYLIVYPKILAVHKTNVIFEGLRAELDSFCLEDLKSTDFSAMLNCRLDMLLRQLSLEDSNAPSPPAGESQKACKISKAQKSSRNWNQGAKMSSVNRLDYSDDSQTALVAGKPLEDQSSSWKSRPFSVWSAFSAFQKELSDSDIEALKTRLFEHLVQKNVSSRASQAIAESVGKDLRGSRSGFLASTYEVVLSSTKKCLSHIFPQYDSSDLLEEIQGSKKSFVVVFVGVNGVGKSTSLAKLSFWLLSHSLRVLVAACDTFRSGAVEQLRVHIERLGNQFGKNNISLYERGYSRDPANVGRDAVGFAQKNQYDVVLIDTAGRMQNNMPLMTELSKIVSSCKPDKIIFVGEALAGNESISQLEAFNQHLEEKCNSRIGGLILSKYDTVDDKVGAALNMALISKAPILFVGVGQYYADLASFCADEFSKRLLSE